MNSKMNAQEFVPVLGDISSPFDGIVTDLGLTKIKTIGDAYMIVSGAPEERYDQAESMMECGLRMLIALERLCEETGRDIRHSHMDWHSYRTMHCWSYWCGKGLHNMMFGRLM
jgi:class 3 adenylate cyclase